MLSFERQQWAAERALGSVDDRRERETLWCQRGTGNVGAAFGSTALRCVVVVDAMLSFQQQDRAAERARWGR